MNSIRNIIKNKLIEITLKKNKLLGRLGLLPAKKETFGSITNILQLLTSSKIVLQLSKKDEKDKDYIFSVIKTLDKNGVQVTLTECDKIFSNQDIETISKISQGARINFRYVYPNFCGATNVSTKMDISSYIETMKKVKHLTKVATSNFTKREEQIMFIANQISEYVNYDFDWDKKSEEEFLKLSSLQGCLEGRKTVCAGVAFAFERCMTEIGVENMIIFGYSGKKENPSFLDGNHVWNKVKIADKWYNVDITNILSVPNSRVTKEQRLKKYILSSDKSIGHQETDSNGIPEARESFPNILELYGKVDNVKNILSEYDNGNKSTFLQYKTKANPIRHQDNTPLPQIEKEL